MQNNIGDEEVVSPLAVATMKALENKGVEVEDPTSLPDLQSSLQKLQQQLAALAGEPTTPDEVRKYDEGLQELAIQVAPEVQKNQEFLNTVEERDLQQEPAFTRRVKIAQEYLANIAGSKVASYVKQVRLFMGLENVQRFADLREKLDELVEQKLAFKTWRSPRIPLSPHAVVSREIGDEFIYLPQRGSIISEKCWELVVKTRDRVREAGAKFRASIGDRLRTFQRKATPGHNPWKATHEEVEEDFFLSTSFPETRRKEDEISGAVTYEKTGRIRLARMIIRGGHGVFTVEDVFDPDGIDFILEQSRYRGGRIRWFPLAPEKFDPEKAPHAIREIVWPAIQTWYRSLAIAQKSDISVVELMQGETGFCGFFVAAAETYNRGPDDLTLGIHGTGKETLILKEYISRDGVFQFDDLLNQEFSIKETGGEVPPEYQRMAIQARIVRGFLNLAVGWQRNSELFAQTRELEPKVTVTEGFEGKTGHSIFHIPRAQIDGQGPAHLTCHLEWQEEGAVLLNYASWVDPREGKSRGAIELNIGILVPRHPVESEEPDIRVLRYFLSQRKDYEARKASQGEVVEENNGAS